MLTDLASAAPATMPAIATVDVTTVLVCIIVLPFTPRARQHSHGVHARCDNAPWISPLPHAK